MFAPDLVADLIELFGGIFSGAFIGNFWGCHNFTSYTNNGLERTVQIVHLESGFYGIFRVSSVWGAIQ
jgi:hypothetical protein